MKINLNFFKSLLFVAAVLFLSSFVFIGEAEWELKKDKDNVKVWVRPVAGSSFKEFKSEIVVKSTLGGLVSIIDDPSTYVNWMYNCIEGKHLKREGRDKGYTYTVTKAPWPVSDRDAVISYVLTQDTKTKDIRISLKGDKNYLPDQGKVRVESLNGFWEFRPINNGFVKVTYQLHTNPSGSIPASIANAFVVDLPFNTLVNLKKMLDSPSLNSKKFDGIIEP